MITVYGRKFLTVTLALVLVWPQGLIIQVQAAPASITLGAIDIGEDRVVVRRSGAGPYKCFATAKPPRIVLELPNTEFAAEANEFKGRGAHLLRVRAGQYQQAPQLISRIVLDLKSPASYRVASRADSAVVIQLLEDADPAAVVTAKETSLHSGSASQTLHSRPMTEEDAAPMSSQNSQEVVSMLDVPIGAVNEDKGVAAAQPRSSPSAYHDILSHLPQDRVSIDFDGTDIRDVISFLAAKSKVNIVYSPDVRGTLTLHLANVSFPEAFRTIMSMMTLSTTQVGDNILRVMAPTELARQRSSATTITKVIALNYSKANEVVGLVNSVRTAEGRTGVASADPKTNSLIVTEAIESMPATERLITQLDQRPKQVLIEVKLVEVDLNNSLNYGIAWDYAGSQKSNLGGSNLIGQTASGQTTTTNGGAPGSGTGANIPLTGVALPASGALGALTLGRVTNSYFLSATLTAAAAQGKAKVLSDPKVATLNNQPANINVTTSFPYLTSNIVGGGATAASTVVNYSVTGIQLTVTPTINADGRITLVLNPTVSQPSQTIASVNGAPAVDSRNAQTTVLVRDGETIVIGGLISDSVSNNISKVPLLGDIPILGWLFKSKSLKRNRTELLIFVTSAIMPD